MEPLLVRKNRPSLDVEPLEDRRMLSLFTFVVVAAPAWEGDARSIDTQAEVSPMSPGPSDSRFVGSDTRQPDRAEVSWLGSPGVVAGSTDETTESDASETVCVATTPATPEPEASNPVVSSESVANPADPVEAATQQPWSAPSAPSNQASADPTPRDSGLVSTASLVVIPAQVATPRGLSTFSSTRSSVESVATSARSEVSSTSSPSATAPARSASAPTLLAVASVNGSTTEVASSSDQAKGLSVANLPLGPGTLAGPSSPSVLVVSPLKEAANPSSPLEIPVGSGVEPGHSEIGESGSALQTAGRPADFELPEPALADSILSFSPFDRSAIEAAFDRFFEPFDDLASSLPELRGPLGLIYGSLAAAAAVVAVEVALRLRRVREEELGADELDGLSPFAGPRLT